MTKQTNCVPLIRSEAQYAFFFDVDGTLATIQSCPDEVFIPPAVIADLQRLAACCDGALALVSGRQMRELDILASPAHFALAGVHGAECRDLQNKVTRIALNPNTVNILNRELEQMIAALPGTSLESKGMAFALHYRQAPEYQEMIEARTASLVARFPELVQQPGKCVVELKPKGVNKGTAIADFMQQAPFTGRIPVFLGDDLTDEAGFAVVNAMNGISIKVSTGSTVARGYLNDIDGVYCWLKQTRLKLDKDATTSVKESRL